MLREKVFVGLAVAGLLASVLIVPTFSQEGGRRQGNAEGGRRRNRRWNREEMNKRILDSIKGKLGVTDEECEALKPKVEKVRTLSAQARRGRGMGMAFARRRRRQPAEGEQAPELSPIDKAAQELQKVADNKDSKPEEIKEKLTALRKAREDAAQQLEKAQKELRELLSARQEAQLVLLGMLN